MVHISGIKTSELEKKTKRTKARYYGDTGEKQNDRGIYEGQTEK